MNNAPQIVLRDVRGRGFANRASVREAIAWVDGFTRIRGVENVALDAAHGRVLAEPFACPADLPSVDLAASDGYALRSCETIGAGSYNPLPFSLQDSRCALSPFSAALVHSGNPLPMGADAVAAFDLAQADKTVAHVIGSIAAGEGINAKGHEARKDTILIGTSRPLRASDLGLISSFGIERIDVVRRPLVRILLAGCKTHGEDSLSDANGSMLRALIPHDGGTVETCSYGVTRRETLQAEIARPGSDLVFVSGLTGTGMDDEAPLALADAGTLQIHGIAMNPGGSTALGLAGCAPVILLPGNPLDCLCAYEFLAGRLLRILSGCAPTRSYRVQKAKAGRKIISAIGTTEICQVRLTNGEAIPVGSADSGGLASVARADGYIVIPASTEGHAPGAIVDVHLYDEAYQVKGIEE